MRSRSERQTCLQQADALRPTCGGRSTRRAPSLSPADEAINPNRQTGSQRKERSTPSARPVSSGRSDPLQSLNGCPTGEGLITPTAGLGPRTESYVKSAGSIRAACEGPTSTPLRQHSLVGDRGRANHPPVMPVQQGSRTQGFYGRKPWKKPNNAVIITARRPAKEGLRRPFPEPPPNRSLNLTTNPSHSRPGYRHRSPKLSLFRSSRFLIALRVSKSAV